MPSLCSFLDQGIAFKNYRAYSRKDKYGFSSRMQTDPSASIHLDKILVREIHIDTTAKVPDVSLNLPDSLKCLLQVGLHHN